MRRIQNPMMREGLTNSSGHHGIIEAKVRRQTGKMIIVREFKERGLLEEKSTHTVTVVTLKGAEEGLVKEAVKALAEKNPKLEFVLKREEEEPLRLPKGTDVVVFIANGSINGVQRLLDDTEEQREMGLIGTVLVSDEKHPEATDMVDNMMTFANAFMGEGLVLGVKAAHYYQRGEIPKCA